MGRELFPHQVEARTRAMRLGSMGFFMGCRTGKTLSTISTVEGLQGWPCLIICPVAAIATWKAELLREGITEEEIVVVRSKKGTKGAINKLLLPGKYHIINFDTLKTLDALYIRSSWQPSSQVAALATGRDLPVVFRVPGFLNLPDWRTVVVDESYKIANGENKTTQYIMQQPKPEQQHRFCLSGTPAAENPYQYASQFIFMDGHFFGCTSYAEYMQKYWVWNEYKREYLVADPAHLDAIRDHVQRSAYCVTMYELGLGCSVFQTEREVEQTQDQQELFQWLQYARTYTHKKTGEIMEMEPGVRALMHRQIAAGVHPMTGEIISTEKILDFIQYHKDTGQQLLVSSFFKGPIIKAVELCQDHGIKAAAIYGGVKEADVEQIRLDFQAGKLDIIVGQEDKISRALDFSALGAIFILSASFSEETREQLEERGQNVLRVEPYEIINQHTRGSIEKSITEILTIKKKNARYYLDQLNFEIMTGHKKI